MHLVGRKCIARQNQLREIQGDSIENRCLCEKFRYPIKDHGRRFWRDGSKVVRWEPYSATMSDLVRLAQECERVGLSFTARGDSQWSPGGTFVIEFAAGAGYCEINDYTAYGSESIYCVEPVVSDGLCSIHAAKVMQ